MDCVVCLDCECMEFVIAGWFKMKLYDFVIEVGASYEKSYLPWSANLSSGDFTCTDEGWSWGNESLKTGFMCLLDLSVGIGE